MAQLYPRADARGVRVQSCDGTWPKALSATSAVADLMHHLHKIPRFVHTSAHTHCFSKRKIPQQPRRLNEAATIFPRMLKSSGNCEKKHTSERNCSFSRGAWGMRELRGCYSRKSDYGDAAAHMQPSCAILQMIVTERRIGLRDARVPAQIGLHPSAVPQLSPCGNKTSAWTSQRLTNDTRWLQLLIWNIPIRLPAPPVSPASRTDCGKRTNEYEISSLFLCNVTVKLQIRH